MFKVENIQQKTSNSFTTCPIKGATLTKGLRTGFHRGTRAPACRFLKCKPPLKQKEMKKRQRLHEQVTIKPWRKTEKRNMSDVTCRWKNQRQAVSVMQRAFPQLWNRSKTLRAMSDLADDHLWISAAHSKSEADAVERSKKTRKWIKKEKHTWEVNHIKRQLVNSFSKRAANAQKWIERI